MVDNLVVLLFSVLSPPPRLPPKEGETERAYSCVSVFFFCLETKEAKIQAAKFSTQNLQKNFILTARAVRLLRAHSRIALLRPALNPSLILYVKNLRASFTHS